MSSLLFSPKQIAKRSLQHAAARFGRHQRKSGRPELLVLMYHRILPGQDERAQIEEPGMVVAPETLRRHIDILHQYFDIVKLSDWLEIKAAGESLPSKACVITFDDGWADNYEYAYPILRESDTPATIFLVSDMIGTDKRFWPERLARLVTSVAEDQPNAWMHPVLEWITHAPVRYAFDGTPPSSEVISGLIAYAKQFSDADMHTRLDNIEDALAIHPQSDKASLLSWEQMAEMSASGLVEAGSHTRRHTRLNEGLSETMLEDEIVNSSELIKEKSGRAPRAFCFPNGDYSPKALEMVREHYACAVTTASGWNDITTDSHLLHRIGIHQDIAHDRTAFLARISGLI